jgi:hypothetical protein
LLASRQLYVPTQQPSYSALLPAGWQQASGASSLLAAATTVKSPVDDGATITVGQIAKPAKTLRAESLRVQKAASSASGFHRDSSAQTTLVGHRSAWALSYHAGGESTAYYLIPACRAMYAVAATVPASRGSLLRTRILIVAGTLQGNC